jgi:hypothetical protein
VKHGLAGWLDRRFGHGRIDYAGLPEVDSRGMAYINKWFEATIRLTRTPYISMVASDDIVTKAWAEGVLRVLQSADVQRPLVITPRWEVNVTESVFTDVDLSRDDSGDSFADQLESTLAPLHGRGQSGGGIEVFSFSLCNPPLNFSRFPPFLAGRPKWDTWLLEWSNRCATSISFNFSLRVYHLDHPRTWNTKPDDGVAHNYRVWRNSGGRSQQWPWVQWVVTGTQYQRGPINHPDWSQCK